MKIIAMLAVAFVLGCGPSSAEVKMAQDASYSGDPAAMYAAAKSAATNARLELATSDDAALKFTTAPIWYTPEGQMDTTTGNNISRLQEDSINMSWGVQLVKTGDAYKVSITPVVLRKHGLTSLPETMDPTDPAIPGWAGGKTDKLALDIHDALKPYAKH
jgi:hypothetical protein